MAETRLRIKKFDDDHLSLEALAGVTHYGFGLFLEHIDADEIEADEFSKSVLLAASEKSGLNGLEIWRDNRIAWGTPDAQIIMPVSEVSVHEGARAWLKTISVPT